jgi:hypothetical protein
MLPIVRPKPARSSDASWMPTTSKTTENSAKKPAKAKTVRR